MLFASLLFFALPIFAEDAAWQTACFSGLNDSVSPALIGDCEAQSALNVEANLSGNSIARREGYAISASLTIATSPVNGTYHYRDSNGNNVDIVCHDRTCARSVNGNAYVVFLTTAGGTGTLPSRWSFADINGNLYLANDRRDKIGKWDGTNFTSPTGFPQGSIIALTQDRMAIGDISGNINRVYYSSSGAVENWTVGSNNDDPYYDDMGSPGERITGLIHHRGVFYIFKSKSITGCNLGTQFTTTCSILSSTIGTNDPASIVPAGSDLYFKGNDGHFWKLSGGGSGYNLGPGQLDQISRKIYVLLSGQSQGAQRDNVQTTKSDWEGGVQTPTGTWDTASVNGSIFPSSFTVYHSSASDFSGTLMNVSTAVSGSVCIVGQSSQSFKNAGAEIDASTNWTTIGDWSRKLSAGASETMFGSYIWDPNGWARGGNIPIIFYVMDENANVLKSNSYTVTDGMIPTLQTIDLGDISVCTIILEVKATPSDSVVRRIRTVPFVKPSSLKIMISDNDGGVGDDTAPAFDIWEGSVYTTSGTYTSQVIDTNFSTPVFGAIGLDVSSGTNRTVNILARTSANGTSGWTNNVVLSTFSATWPASKRYVQYSASFTITAATETPAMLNSISIPYATTGYFVTQCIQPDTAISQWGTLSCSETTSGNGSIVYYATSSATCATLPSTDPSDATKWIGVVTNNADLNIATNTAVKIGFLSLLRASTDQAQVDSCTLSWKSGTPAQPVWGLYDSIKNSIYWTTTIGSSITYANRLLKYDLNTQGWFPFDLKAQAPVMAGLVMYYGDSTAGKLNRYGGVDSDSGGGIQAHWTTRDIGATQPFQEKDFKKVSLLSKNEGSGTADATWLLSDGKTGSWTVTLSTGPGLNYTRSNYNLPFSSPQNFMNLTLGNDNANEPFEFLGIRVDYFVRPWRVSGP